jgi:hypothetical protein
MAGGAVMDVDAVDIDERRAGRGAGQRRGMKRRTAGERE